MFVDSHCHIPLITGDIALADIFQQTKQHKVDHMLCVSIDLEGMPYIIELADQYNMISASVGVHPNYDPNFTLTNELLLEWAVHPQVVAIGETGLDYFRNEDIQYQKERFRQHIAVAKSVKKPLIIHTRDAKEDVIQILTEENAAEVGGVMHCFVEDIETAQQAIELNFMISFSGIVTFKNAQALKEVAKQVPLENMLIETDSPYLAPTPFRGKVNQPAYVGYVAEEIAELKSVPVETVAKHTSDNYYQLFGAVDK